jgi:hypothetical protein
MIVKVTVLLVNLLQQVSVMKLDSHVCVNLKHLVNEEKYLEIQIQLINK